LEQVLAVLTLLAALAISSAAVAVVVRALRHLASIAKEAKPLPFKPAWTLLHTHSLVEVSTVLAHQTGGVQVITVKAVGRAARGDALPEEKSGPVRVETSWADLNAMAVVQVERVATDGALRKRGVAGVALGVGARISCHRSGGGRKDGLTTARRVT
jgi:hypothetical protein